VNAFSPFRTTHSPDNYLGVACPLCVYPILLKITKGNEAEQGTSGFPTALNKEKRNF